MDGSKFFGSNKKSCAGYLVNNKHNFYSGEVMSNIGEGSKSVIGFELYKPSLDPTSKNEVEQNSAKRLLTGMSLFKIIRARWNIEN